MPHGRVVRARVAIVVSHPIPHFCPLYQALAEDGRLETRVFFGSRAGATPYFDPLYNRLVQSQSNALDGYEHEFLPGAEGVTDVYQSVRNEHVPERLAAFDPDVVQVYGFHHHISRAGIWWARRRGRGVMFVADSELRRERSRFAWLRKRLTLPLMFRQVDAFLTVGDCNEQYYRYYWVGRDRLFRSPYPVDEKRLRGAVGNRRARRAVVRRRWDLPEEAVVGFYAGKLVESKCPDHAVEALGRLWSRGWGGRLFLLFAGDGPMRQRLEDMVSSLCPGAVRMAGFVPVEELPDYYMAADFLVHPSSRDAHPLATSEAVYCGLPVIVSDRVGSVGPTDDVRPGRNGFEYPCGDIEALTVAMKRLAEDRQLRERMGAESLEIRRGRGLQASVDGYVQAVDSVMKRRGRR